MGELVIHDLELATMRCRDCGMDYGEIMSEELRLGTMWWHHGRPENPKVDCTDHALTFPQGEVVKYPRAG